jgi:glutamyl-tRNA reductase
MNLIALGLNHTTAPVAVRERVSFPGEGLRQALADLRTSLSGLLPEGAILSTCNRTEIYCASPRPGEIATAVSGWLAQRQGLAQGQLQSHLYVLPDGQAVRHAFRVAAGLDSMVIGEPQILGQLKDAVRAAQDTGALGTHLHQLFQRSFAVAKEVRSTTEIGAHSVSMAAAAVRLARRIFEDLRETRVLFVGAGEMIELCATHFAAQHPRALVVANRTEERGEKLAHQFGGGTLRLSELPEQLEHFDIVVSCTASALPIIGLGMVERASRARRRRPMFMVDLAVPRDIEPEVARLRDVYLYTVDDLSTVVQAAGEKRHAAVERAEAIVDAGVQSFAHWLDQRATVPLIQALNRQADDWRAAELARARKMLAKGDDVEAVLEALSRGLAHKMLHGTMAELHAADGPQREELAHTVSRLFLRGGGRAPGDGR